MRFFSPLLATTLTLLAMAAAQTNLNGIGSTPFQRHYISAAQTTAVIDAARASAEAINIPQNIAVVDPSGLLVGFLRMDNAYPGSIDISQKKARTSVLFNGITSDSLLNASFSGGGLYAIQETNGGLVVFGGGLPIYQNGEYFLLRFGGALLTFAFLQAT